MLRGEAIRIFETIERWRFKFNFFPALHYFDIVFYELYHLLLLSLSGEQWIIDSLLWLSYSLLGRRHTLNLTGIWVQEALFVQVLELSLLLHGSDFPF